MTEEAPAPARQLILAVRCLVPVSKQGYMELLRNLEIEFHEGFVTPAVTSYLCAC